MIGCYMMCPFGHPVACCWMFLRALAQSLKPVKVLALCAKFETGQSFSPLQTSSNGRSIKATTSQHFWELLRPFKPSLTTKFHVVIVQTTEKECTKNVQNCLFAN